MNIWPCRFSSVPDLIEAIFKFIEQWNKDGKTFVLRAKAEAILEKLERCRARMEEIPQDEPTRSLAGSERYSYFGNIHSEAGKTSRIFICFCIPNLNEFRKPDDGNGSVGLQLADGEPRIVREIGG